MKKIHAFLFAVLGAASSVSAQCAHDPTIVPASGYIFCAGESDTLWTQVYDSYQWYQGSNPIAGATNQYLVVSSNDAGYTFSVEATLNSCAEMSPSVLIDGWAFAGLTVMTAGDPYYMDSMAIPHNCPGDTLLLILMPPFEINIQWYVNGNPIVGATDDTLLVTQTGTYEVSGAPSVCPNFIQGSLPLYYHFWPVVTPVISMQGTMLVCAPSNAWSYQWYLNGNPVPGATTSTFQPTASGSYTVKFHTVHGCDFFSSPFGWMVGMKEDDPEESLAIYPNPAGDRLNITTQKNGAVHLIIRDVAGREVLRQTVMQEVTTVDVTTLGAGAYSVEFVDQNGMRLSSAQFMKR